MVNILESHAEIMGSNPGSCWLLNFLFAEDSFQLTMGDIDSGVSVNRERCLKAGSTLK